MRSFLRYWVVATYSVGITITLGWLTFVGSPRVTPAQTPQTPEATAEESSEKERAEFSDYRSWKSVGEPVKVPNLLNTLCAPPSALQIRNQTGPHGDKYIAVYVNAVGKDAYVKEKSPAFAEGTVIVKEKLTKKNDMQPQELAIMIKRKKGFDPKGGDWQYLFADAKNNLVPHQQVKEKCAWCHGVYENTDFVSRKSWTALDFRKAD